MLSPLVSIIVPVYNVENYIALCIESILNQSYQHFEVLIIDDGSMDGSIDVVRRFNDSRIRIFQKENGGLSDARNFGLERAKGEFIYFVDPDDWIESSLLEENLALLIHADLDFIIFGYYKDRENCSGHLVRSEKVTPQVDFYSKGAFDLKIDEYHLSIMGYAWNKIYRKSFLSNNQFIFLKDISLVEDIVFNASVFSVSERIHFNRKCYYHYMHRPVKTLTSVYHDKAYDWLLLKVNAIRGFLTAWNLPVNTIDQLVANVYIKGLRFILDKFYSRDKSDQVVYEVYDLLHKKETIKNIQFYKPGSFKDYLYILLIKYKCVSILNIIKGRYFLSA